MTKRLLWSASYAWLALMGIVWALFVPKGPSLGLFILGSVAGSLSLVAAAQGRGGVRPSHSTR